MRETSEKGQGIAKTSRHSGLRPCKLSVLPGRFRASRHPRRNGESFRSKFRPDFIARPLFFHLGPDPQRSRFMRALVMI